MNSTRSIQRLMMAVVQIQDADNAINALQAIGMYATHISSTGAFLGMRNATLLIGMPKEQEDSAVQALDQSCRRRVEYMATSLEGAPFHPPLSTPVTVGGATIFTLDVEKWEEIR